MKPLEFVRSTCAQFDATFGKGSVRNEAMQLAMTCVLFWLFLHGVAMIGGHG